MAAQCSPDTEESLAYAAASPKPHPAQRVVNQDANKLTLPTGPLSLSGVVRANGVAVSRTVRLYDRLTGELISETVSAGDGSYSFGGLPTRASGFNVEMMGVIASGERDDIIPGVHPA